MDLTPYLDSLRRDLAAAAGAGTEESRAAAERLALALEPAARLALMEAISQAASEITSELPEGTVDVRLTGRDLDFVVHVDALATSPASPPPVPPAAAEHVDEDEGLARVSLRIPESLKARAEELAGDAGQSLNTWLVAAVRQAARGAVPIDVDLSSIPFFGTDPFADTRRGARRRSGWV